MRITNISADVRLVHYGHPSYDIAVEQQTAGQWSRAATFNEISNDYAYTEARSRAHALADELRRPEHFTAASIATPRVVRVLGGDARLSANDEPDESERAEVVRGFAIARGLDPFGQAAADRAQQDELTLMRARGYL